MGEWLTVRMVSCILTDRKEEGLGHLLWGLFPTGQKKEQERVRAQPGVLFLPCFRSCQKTPTGPVKAPPPSASGRGRRDGLLHWPSLDSSVEVQVWETGRGRGRAAAL